MMVALSANDLASPARHRITIVFFLACEFHVAFRTGGARASERASKRGSMIQHNKQHAKIVFFLLDGTL